MSTSFRTRGRGLQALALALALSASACGSSTPDAATPSSDVQIAIEPSRVRSRAPMELTSDDGSGLALTTLDARAVIEGPLAFTELHLVFFNPEKRVREGTFAIELPPDASVSRFAMAIGGVMQEGEVVERVEARQVYESFMHRRVDPALLEKTADGRFRARVFPIQANGLTEVVLSYVHPLPSAAAAWRLPLAGLPRIEELRVDVSARPEAGGPLRHVKFGKNLWQPEGDLVVRGASSTRGVEGGAFAVARVVPPSPDRAEPTGSVAVLVDTSASAARGFEARLDRLAKLLDWWREEAPGDATVSIVAFDQEASTVWSGPARDLGGAAVVPLRARGALGATDLGAALRHVASIRPHPSRLLLVSDGLPTAGATDEGGLAPALAAARNVGIRRVDALSPSAPRSDSWLHTAARAGAAPGSVLALDDARAEALEGTLGRVAGGALRVDVENSLWHWPTSIAGVVPGEPILVVAERSAGGPLVVSFEAVDGAKSAAEKVALASAPAALTERAVAEAKVRQLSAEYGSLAEGDPRRAPLRELALSLSLRSRVLSDFTSLLVLESDGDYTRFGIDRRANARVMAVGAAGVEVVDRPRVLLPAIGDRRGPFDALFREGDEGARGFVRDADSDGDGVFDREDACPREPGSVDPNPSRNGCRRLVMLSSSEIVILDKIYFEAGSSRILPRSMPIVEAIGEVMRDHPEIELVEIGGHTDSTGGDAANLAISQSRADAVRAAVIARGVASSRLVSKGYGETRPIAPNDSQDGREHNRRVEFHILRVNGVDQGGARVFEPPPVTRAPAVPPAPPQPPPPRPAVPQPPSQPGPMVEMTPTPLREVHRAMRSGDAAGAVRLADAWRQRAPQDVLAYVALGEARRAERDLAGATRAFGSLLDIGSDRAEIRRTAGLHLDALQAPPARELAVDAYRKALAVRDDHPSAHRLLAFALVRAGRPEEGFAVLRRAIRQPRWVAARFAGVDATLREDLAIIGAVWARTGQRAEAEAAAKELGIELAAAPSLRFVLTWETDASNLDLEVAPLGGGPTVESRLDATQGYGPDVGVVAGAPSYPYQLGVRHTQRGAQGFIHGKVEVVEHDGAGNVRFDERPFVILGESGSLDLGQVDGTSLGRGGR